MATWSLAGAGGVKLPGNVVDLLFEASLNVHVDVFEFRTPGEGVFLDFLLDAEEAAADGFGLFLRDDALLG